MDEKTQNDTSTVTKTTSKSELKSKASNSSAQSNTPLNRTLRLEYNEIIKLLKTQDEKVKLLEKEIVIIKKVLKGRI